MLKNITNTIIVFLNLSIRKVINKENTATKKITVGNIRFRLDICKLDIQESSFHNTGQVKTKNHEKRYIPPKMHTTLKNIFLFPSFNNASNPNPESKLAEKQNKNIILVGTAVETKGIWKKYIILAKYVSNVRSKTTAALMAKNQKYACCFLKKL